MSLKFFIVFLLFFFICFIGLAQDHVKINGSVEHQYITKNFTVKNGLPNNQILKFCEDSKGFIYITTKGGLTRFDGKRFYTFSGFDFQDNEFYSVYEINEDMIAATVAFSDKVAIFRKNKFIKGINFNSDNNLSINQIYLLNKNYFVVGYTIQYQNEISTYFYDIYDNITFKKVKTINLGTLSFVKEIKNNYLLIYENVNTKNATVNLYEVDKKLNLKLIKRSKMVVITSDVFSSLYNKFNKTRYEYCIEKGKIKLYRRIEKYFTDYNINFQNPYNYFKNGYFKRNSNNEFEYFSDDKKAYNFGKIPNGTAQTMFDSNDNLWINTEQGVFLCSNLGIEEYKLNLNNNGLDQIWSIAKDKSDNYFFSSYGSGYYCSKDRLKTWFKIPENTFKNKKNKYATLSMLNTSADGMLYPFTCSFTYINGNKSFYSGELVNSSDIFSTLEDAKNHCIYISDWLNVYKFDEKKFSYETILKLPFKGMTNIMDLGYDKDGNVIAIGSKVLMQYKNKKWNKILNKSSGFFAITLDNKGFNWIGGKNLFTYKDGKLSKIEYNFSTIVDVFNYKNKWLLIGETYGLSFLNLQKYHKNKEIEIIRYDSKTLNILDGGQQGFLPEGKDYVWWCCSDKMLKINPNLLLKKQKINPPTLFEISYKNPINDSIVRISDTLNQKSFLFDKKVRDITLHFATAAINNNNLLRYRVRLNGYEKNWEILNDIDEITYRNLPPDNYSFEMQASLDGIEWTKSSFSIPIIIQPYYFETIIFKIFIVCLSFLIIFLVIQYYLKQKQDKLKSQNTLLSLQQSLNAMQLDNLNKQLDPHEIKNILANISPEIQRKAPDAYNKMTKLLNLTRASLSCNSITDSIENQLQQIEDYLSLEKTVLAVPLHYTINNTVDLSKQIPRLLLKNLVENAIKHGIKNKKEGGEINIILSEKDNIINITVDDTGIGRQQAISLDSGIGTSTYINLFETLNKSNIHKASFEIIDKEQGTKVDVIIPMDYKYV